MSDQSVLDSYNARQNQELDDWVTSKLGENAAAPTAPAQEPAAGAPPAAAPAAPQRRGFFSFR